MEYEHDDENQDDGMWNRIKESPRTVSVLIIILIVAAAIYAFSDDGQTPEDVSVDDEISEEVAVSDDSEEAMESDAASDAVMEEEAAMSTPSPVSSDELVAQTESLPTVELTDEGYVETAAAGDGITHLARRATTRYLSENEVGFELTNEHRIFIEDYVQNRIGSQGLSLGEQVSVSYQLIDEAVTAAENLTPAQLNNLTQYTPALM